MKLGMFSPPAATLLLFSIPVTQNPCPGLGGIRSDTTPKGAEDGHFEVLPILTANVCSVYMAASRRSPLMRDQWRAEDNLRSDRDRRERDRSRHRARSPIHTRPIEGSSDVGLKIRGRATAHHSTRDTSRDRDRSTSPVKTARKARPLSPPRRANGEGSKRARELSEERHIKRSRHRDFSPIKSISRDPRSISPHRRSRRIDYERRRSPSPRHTDRGVLASDRRRERPYSPLYSPRRDHYLPSRDRISDPSDRSIRDSYIPSSRRVRSRSPDLRDEYRPKPSRRHSPSPARHPRHRDQAHTRHQDSRRGSPERVRKQSPPLNTRRRYSRETSPIKDTEIPSRSSKRSDKQKSRTLKHLVNKPKQHTSSRHSSPAPRRSRKEETNMQSSTRPIQSILDDQPRQPSPPRPIPSFDDSTGAADAHIREAFPMHGMKANDMHSNHRRGPNHIDTRQPYATSPQFLTPTSSHHGSPQSGSPYSHGRGGWGGQHFQGQPG